MPPLTSTSRRTTSLLPSISKDTSLAPSPLSFEHTTPIPSAPQPSETYATSCEYLNITPNHVTIHGVHVGSTYHQIITITNTSTSTRTIRITSPQTKHFHIDMNHTTLAPGLSLKLKISCIAIDVSIHDRIIVACGSTSQEKVMIPLHAYIPESRITCDTTVNMGTVILHHPHAHYLEVRNEGTRGGEYRIEFHEDVPITVFPSRAFLEPAGTPGSTIRVRLEVTCTELGIFRAMGRIHVEEGQPSLMLDVSCHVVTSGIQIVKKGQGSPLTDLSFGACYFGGTRTIVTQLINDSPQATDFSITLSDADDEKSRHQLATLLKLAPSSTSHETSTTSLSSTISESDDTITASIVGEQDDDTTEDGYIRPDMIVTPTQGHLEPYSRIELTFTFQPRMSRTLQRRVQGYKHQEKSPIHIRYQVLARVDMGEKQRLMLAVVGIAQEPNYNLSIDAMVFGECPVHERRDAVTMIKNKSDTLPLDFAFTTPLAHYHVTPTRGRLAPLESRELMISFVPHNMGYHHGILQLSLANGSCIHGITVSGMSSSIGVRTKHVTGKLALPKDFEPTHTILSQTSSTGNAIALDRDPIESARKHQFVYRTGMDDPVLAAQYTGRWEVKEHSLDSRDTYTARELELVKSERKKYDSFLAQSRKERNKKKREQAGLTNPYEDRRTNDPSGLSFASGIPSPRLTLPRPSETLPLQYAMAGHTGMRTKKRTTVVPTDSDAPHKPYKTAPSTLAEKRDCEMTLTPQDLQNIIRGPKLLDFGRLCLTATETRLFTVTNDLEQHIQCDLSITCPELSRSHPQHQMIPAGGTATFHIIFSSGFEQKFQHKLNYTINGQHTFQVAIQAEVTPMSVDISRSDIDFQWDVNNTEFSILEKIDVHNIHSVPVEFWWTTPTTTDVFTVSPSTGTLAPHQILPITIAYEPKTAQSPFTTELLLNVKDGPSKKITVHASLPPADLGLRQKGPLDFGIVCAGQGATRTATIRNRGMNATVFAFADIPQGITLQPMTARLETGTSCAVNITVMPYEQQSIRTTLIAQVRGGKPLKINLKGEAIVPDVAVAEDEIDFGGVTIGTCATRRITLLNRSTVPVTLTLDLTIPAMCGQFSLEYARNWTYDGDIFPFQRITKDGSDDDDHHVMGVCWKIDLAGESSVPFDLVFTPVGNGTREYTLELPLQLSGIPSFTPLRRLISATSLAPRVSLSQTRVDMGSRVVLHKDRAKKQPYSTQVVILNEDNKSVSWSLQYPLRSSTLTSSSSSTSTIQPMTPDDDDTLTWRIEPTCGTLAPGSEHIITCWFAPTSSRTYELPVGVFLDDDTTTPYLEWMVTGEGMHPQLTFDREQVILPVVPLGVKSSTTFQILNQGYENLELKYTIQGNSSVLGSSETATSTDARLPLTITFPEGSTLGMGRNIIPVTISFLAKKSISFITRITFYGVGQGQDDVPNRFHIDVTGTSDNSLITTQSWIDTYHKNNAMEWHIHETKPIMVTAKQMVTIESARDDIDTERAIFSPDGHDIDDTVSSMGGFPTTTIVNEHRLTPPLAHISNRMHPDAIYDRTLDAVLSYLRASHLLHAVASHWDRPATGTLDTPASPSRSSRLDASSIVNMSVDSFPQEILASHGRVVRDLIRIISGHAVTDPNAPPQRTITHPSNQQPSKNDLTMSLYKEYIILLNHMKGHGALLGAIRPEHCLSLAQYLRLLSIPTYQQEQKDILPTSTTEWTRYHQTIERTFASISRHTWLTILLQIIKIYILPRINMTSFKSLSGLSPELPIMSWNHSGSNIYSTSESILLSWLTHHWNKYNPLEPRRITRFDTDLADGSVLAGVLLSHVPSLTILHKWSKTSDRIENVTRLMQALRILGITYRLKPHTLLEPNARDLMLFVMYLYQNLPNYIPKTVIEFKGRLHDDITKSIELSNPHSKKSLVYTVRIDGASEYTIDRAHITLAPRGKDGSVQRFPIRFHAKFSATAEARVIFTSEEESNVHGSTLVFLLRSVITSRQPTRVIDDITTSCYEARDVDVRLHNPFASDGVFQVILKMDREPEAPRVKTAPETRKQSVVMSRTSSALGVPRVTSTSTSTSTSNKNDPNFMFPPAFFTKHEKIKLKANTDTTITVQFLPWRVGTYKWQLILLDENLGEFMYALHGNSTLPRALESISLKGSLTLPLQHTLQVSLRNPHIEHARSITVDRIRTLSRSQRESKRARPDWVYQMLKIDLITSPMTYTITSTSPFFTGPNHVTIVEQKGNEKDKRISGRASVFANPLSPFRSQSALSQVMTIDDTTNRIPITFTSRGPGLYATDIVLTSVWDTRVCHIECMVSAQESEPIMEFHVPARQTVSQNIPIVNNSNDTWHIKASITGKHFSGPQDIIIPPKSTSSYTLSFTPPWLCDITGQLELMNMRTADVMTYTLHGVGDEPLAVAHIHREVQARSICEIEIAVANASNTDCLYTIETDMEGWEGASTIRVPANGSELYRLKIKPQLSGLMQGHISFIAPDKKYQWYAIELIVTAPAPEATLVLKTALRSVMRKSIELRNDEDDECTWDVEVAGPGISGPSVFIIPPNTTGSYTFEYRPLTAGISHGTLSFSHPQRGQYFYLLELHGESNAPIKIPNMTCTLGTAVTYPITIENPLDETIVLRSHSSNTRNFVIQPSSITISPFGTAEAHIRYTPSSIDVQQTGELSLEHPLAGRWVYLCTGMGMAPNTMKETIVACPLKQQCSGHVSFRNPFDEMMKVKIELKDTTGTFQLFSKKPHLTLAPFAIHQLAFFFTPHLMRDHDATIIVESMDRERILTWIYPIKGVAEGAVSTSSLDFHTRSRTLLDTTASLPLTGLSHGMLSSPEQFTIELESSQKWENFLARALKIELINDTITHGDESLQIRVKWHPFRPVRIKATLIAVKRSGGRWCFPITLDASEAAPDDTIRMECAAHGSSHITFPLINPGPPSPFQAYFAYDSNPSFSVWPKQGMLDTQGTEFRVTFTPKEYGKERTAKLIVETEHMQWSYMLHGTHPRYEIPAVTAPTIDNKLPSVLKTSTISSTPKNYITTNKKKTTVHGMNSPSSQKRK